MRYRLMDSDGIFGLLLRIVGVSVLSYAALVAMLRISGKRALAKLNAFDLVVTVALGSTLATILLDKELTLAEGVVALATLLLLQWAVSRLSIASRPFRTLVRSEPRLLLEDGRLREDAMRRERVTRGEVEAAIRQQGHGGLGAIAAVVLETDGSMSVIAAEDAQGLDALRSVGR